MSWLFFIDESGHDHRNVPYEVRGGVALHAARLWSFVKGWQSLELHAFGATLASFGKEVKGVKLLDKDRFRWALQGELLGDEARRKLCRTFLSRGSRTEPPSRLEFTAYGQACLEMAHGIFHLLKTYEAVVFAAAIPRNVVRPETYEAAEFLRKDHVFLLERYYYFLRRNQEHGLLIMDEVERESDKRFVRRLHSYFSKTHTGRDRASWIVPTPFFVASEMSIPIQAADLCIYCINWGYRLPNLGMDADIRPEMEEFATYLRRLQFFGQANRESQDFETFGIFFVPDPYRNRAQKEKEITPLRLPEDIP